MPKEVRDTRALLALASLTVIAFAPVCEEIFFRGFLFPGLSKRWGLVAGIVASDTISAPANATSAQKIAARLGRAMPSRASPPP